MGKECRNCIFTATFLNKKQVKIIPFLAKNRGKNSLRSDRKMGSVDSLCAY